MLLSRYVQGLITFLGFVWNFPTIILLFALVQATALVFYILSTLFFKNFVVIFVITVVLCALDFWVVKNVSGRILVGLRWWNEIDEAGESVWKFECLDQQVLFGLIYVCMSIFNESSDFNFEICFIF